VNATPVTIADLRTIDLFDDLDEAALEPWAAAARPLQVEAGEIVVEYGGVPSGVVLLLEGTIRAMLVEGERVEPAGYQEAPTWIFAIPVLMRGPVGVRMQAETDCRVAVIEAEEFRRMALAAPAVHQRIMDRVGPVMRGVTARELNRERLASLGTMAAGLAHELNNPAAAAQRAAAQLAEALDAISSTLGRFVESGIERDQAAQLLDLQREAIAGASERTPLEALDAADAEDELTDGLTALGIPEPWRIAEPLAAAGVDQAWLDRVAQLAGPATDAAVRWVAATVAAKGLAAELAESTERMSALVGRVKEYAYMDRGELVEVDLHDGIETTIAVLAHKLKHTEIEVVREYDRELPRLTVHGSELNQVWTNLIDNAIGALGKRGTITITSRRDGDCAEIDFADDGPGIPADDQERIFDSFFTTKEVGQGSGLGLATARRIVVERHRGSLTVDSEAGRTVFRVRLPIAQT
jgi:signal transduction histidine kinase